MLATSTCALSVLAALPASKRVHGAEARSVPAQRRENGRPQWELAEAGALELWTHKS